MNRIEQFKELSKIFPSLIPLEGKKPNEQNWPQYCERTRDFKPKVFHNRNAGIPCGPANGVLVIDVDNVVEFNKYRESRGWNSLQIPGFIKQGQESHIIFINTQQMVIAMGTGLSQVFLIFGVSEAK